MGYMLIPKLYFIFPFSYMHFMYVYFSRNGQVSDYKSLMRVGFGSTTLLDEYQAAGMHIQPCMFNAGELMHLYLILCNKLQNLDVEMFLIF